MFCSGTVPFSGKTGWTGGTGFDGGMGEVVYTLTDEPLLVDGMSRADELVMNGLKERNE